MTIPAGAEVITEFKKASRQYTRVVSTRGYVFSIPGFKGGAGTVGAAGIGQEHEVVPALKSSQGVFGTTSPRVDRIAAEANTMSGSSSIPDLRPGFKFTLNDQTGGGFGGEYVVTRVRHAAFSQVIKTETVVYYGNEVEVIPATLLFRPLYLTPKPIAQTCTAVVLGPVGETRHVDQFGRVKVKFHWDRYTTTTENNTAWLRVSTLGAGAGRGFMALPEVGDEVLVSFLMGDPDQPVIIGSLHNGAAMPPYALPDNKLLSGFTSRSSAGGVNELIFDDTSGKEAVRVQSTKDVQVTAGGELNLNAGTRIELSGPIRVNGGTFITNLMAGQFVAGASGAGSKTVTFPFPKAFQNPPKVTITANSDPGWDVADTFVASVRKVTTTNCTVNILRADFFGAWSQNLRLNWTAWE